MPGPVWPRLYIITPMPGACLRSFALPPLFPSPPPLTHTQYHTISPLPPVLCIPPATFLVDAVGCALVPPLYISRWCSHDECDAPSSTPPVYVCGGCWNPSARSYATLSVAIVDTTLTLSLFLRV